ncbi:PilZ domain-containing protein [Kaarinaea lacus]
MTISYDEKRDFYRMSTDSTITFREQGSDQSHQGRCINLSASGVLFMSEQRLEPGTIVHINITPDKAVVPPLEATIEVVRAQLDSDEGYAIAGQIKQID